MISSFHCRKAGVILSVVSPPVGIGLAAASVLVGARRYAQSNGDDLDAGIDMVTGISDAGGGSSNGI